MKLVTNLNSNLVTIVFDKSFQNSVQIAESMLNSNGIYIADIQLIDEPNLAQSLELSDSTIIVSFLNTPVII